MPTNYTSSESSDYYQSRDTRPHKCKCGCTFFHDVYMIDRDGIRITRIIRGEHMFACAYCGTVYQVNIDLDASPIEKVWSPTD